MASIITAWVATHTGLPSLQVSGPGVVRAGDRVVAALGTGTHLLSDPLAPIGVPVVYTLGASTATLTRAPLPGRWGSVTDARGRGVASASWQNDGDPEGWDAQATRFPSGAVRWPLVDRPVSGSVRLRVYDPADRPALLALVRRRSPLILCTRGPVAGVDPVRHILVNRISDSRLTPAGLRDITVQFESLPVRSSGLVAPVVTWGEAAALGWRNLSAIGYAQAIAGMP
ncbi:hypothetical protein [Oerskovia sp. Root22]|uniref:hypothetical protein n=1 Tax=Oerskovia sp. Root22 TaxID=1736494 RepID=UPI0006F20D0B|nr:hypothetical protein [Oerskovia sp. Root22]KRC37530.1 hypothetical protein ASE15_05295 [Oerskovia sp. Root22]